MPPLRSKDLLSLGDLSPEEFARLMHDAAAIKRDPATTPQAMRGRSAILLFEKDSLRTRCSFEVGINRLGGHAMYADHSKTRVGARESIADSARNLERYFGLIVARVYDHETVRGLARFARVSVVNALCNRHHPCQALADFQTLAERFGDLRRVKLAYIGEPNNVSNSLLHAAALSGATMTLVAPPGCGFDQPIVDEANAIAATTGATLRISSDPAAVRGHDAVYTDTWFSMGSTPTSEGARDARLREFGPYRVTEDLMALAGPKSIFMHCLPAGRGVEVTDAVMDSQRSAIYDQAENRMWSQMALIAALMSRG